MNINFSLLPVGIPKRVVPAPGITIDEAVARMVLSAKRAEKRHGIVTTVASGGDGYVYVTAAKNPVYEDAMRAAARSASHARASLQARRLGTEQAVKVSAEAPPAAPPPPPTAPVLYERHELWRQVFLRKLDALDTVRAAYAADDAVGHFDVSLARMAEGPLPVGGNQTHGERPTKIVAVVRGGVVQEVTATDAGAAVTVFDVDDLTAQGLTEAEISERIGAAQTGDKDESYYIVR